jgi:hypothetical protein
VNDNGVIRISSAAFWQDGEVGEMSVNVARLTTQQKVLASYPDQSLGSVEAKFPRTELHFTAALVDEPGNDGHAHLYPPAGMSISLRKKAGGKIAAQARIVVQRTEAIPLKRGN